MPEGFVAECLGFEFALEEKIGVGEQCRVHLLE
jgi:hypothetical protein